MKAKAYKLEQFDSGMHYILLDKPTADKFLGHDHQRVICHIGELSFHCAIMPKKGGGYFINIGASVCKQLQLKAGDTIKATFSEDLSAYQFEMPAELEEVLHTDEQAASVFQQLTPSNQRGLIYLVLQVKSTEKRIERALRIAHKIKTGITSPKLIFK
jgi:hypothetical protein